MRILYPNDIGGVAVVIPAPSFTPEQCLSAVPDGKPYLIVEDDAIPEDRTYRDAWSVDFTGAPIK